MHIRFQGWRPPRNPFLRLLLGITGLALLGFFTVFGLVIAAAVMAVIGVRALFRQVSAPTRGAQPTSPPHVRHAPPPPGVIEGEYRVIHHN